MVPHSVSQLIQLILSCNYHISSFSNSRTDSLDLKYFILKSVWFKYYFNWYIPRVAIRPYLLIWKHFIVNNLVFVPRSQYIFSLHGLSIVVLRLNSSYLTMSSCEIWVSSDGYVLFSFIGKIHMHRLTFILFYAPCFSPHVNSIKGLKLLGSLFMILSKCNNCGIVGKRCYCFVFECH